MLIYYIAHENACVRCPGTPLRSVYSRLFLALIRLGMASVRRVAKRQKYDIGRSVQVNDSGLDPSEYTLQQHNSAVEAAHASHSSGNELPPPFLPEDMWNEWLWGFDPCVQCHIECLLNRTHLLGFLLARLVYFIRK